MNLKIVGKNIELGKSFQAYSSARIGEVLKKYSYDAVSTQITLEKRIGNFKAKLKVYLKNKIELDATGRGKDANTSYDDALDHIEKKLRRYHRRMKSHRNFESKNFLQITISWNSFQRSTLKRCDNKSVRMKAKTFTKIKIFFHIATTYEFTFKISSKRVSH